MRILAENGRRVPDAATLPRRVETRLLSLKGDKSTMHKRDFLTQLCLLYTLGIQGDEHARLTAPVYSQPGEAV